MSTLLPPAPALSQPIPEAATAPGEHRPIQGPSRLVLTAICGIGLALRAQHLDEISLWFDEASSWKISQFPIGDMFAGISRDAHPPLYYLILKVWTALAGGSTLALRGLSVVCGILTIVAAYGFVRTALTSEPAQKAAPSSASIEFAALLAAALVAFSGVHIELSMEARPYTLGTFLALLAGRFLLQALRPVAATADWIGLTITAILLSLLHYYGTLTVAALYLFAVVHILREACRDWTPPVRRQAMRLALSAWTVQAVWSLWLPTFLYQQARTSTQPWKPALDWSYLESTCWKALTGGKSSPVPDGVASLAVTVWLASAALLLIVGRRAGRLAAVCTLGPITAATLYSCRFGNIINVRYLIFAQIYLLTGWALLVSQLPRRGLQAGLAVTLTGWFAYWSSQAATVRDYHASFPGVRGAAAYLEKVRDPAELVIVSSPFVHAILWHHLRSPERLFVPATVRDRYDLLGGPPLRDVDFFDLHDLPQESTDRIWTVDVEGLWGRDQVVKLPAGYLIQQERRFGERFGFRMDLRIAEYRRAGGASADGLASTLRERAE